MSITLNQHRENITKRIVTVFEDMPPVRFGFSAFFPSRTTIEKQISIEVRRNERTIAVDVQRCTDPNINRFSRSTEKLYVPPYYDEAWNFTECERYNVTFGQSTNPSTSDAINMINEAQKNIEKLRNKIRRAIELQRAQVLQTGVVTLINGDNIDFLRDANSFDVLAGADLWTEPTASPFDVIEQGNTFIRQRGKSVSTLVNCIMGRDAFRAYQNNPTVIQQSDNRRIDRSKLNMPQFDNVTGLTLQGEVAVGDFSVLIWTYNETYLDGAGLEQYYLDPANILLIAEDFVANTNYAGVPAIVRDRSNAEYPEFITSVEAEMYLNNWIDPRAFAHWFRVTSAPLAAPVSIDRIFTASVV